MVIASLSGMSGRFSSAGIDPHRVPVTGTDNGQDHVTENSVTSNDKARLIINNHGSKELDGDLG